LPLLPSFSEVSSLQSVVGWIGLATLSLVMAGCSLTPERETSPPVALAERTPRAAIEMAFASLNAASTDNAALVRPKDQSSCDELEFLFLNPRCSKMHKRHARLRQHRVATFIIGRPDTSPSTAAAHPESQALSELPPTSNGTNTNSSNVPLRNAFQAVKSNDPGIDKSGDRKAACAQTWPYYDRACMLKPGARVVRVIDLDRHLRAGEGKHGAP
jgi:hypothetical protein